MRHAVRMYVRSFGGSQAQARRMLREVWHWTGCKDDGFERRCACPSCGTIDLSHMAARIGTRELSNGMLEQFIECSMCTNCGAEFQVESFDILKAVGAA